jgi:DNA (cytosine-5)-methyltransferase 1
MRKKTFYPKNENMTYISLFSSAGVGCYGFTLNGFQCIATNELIERRLKIQKYNHKCKYDSGYIPGDITKKIVQNKIFNEISKWKKNENMSDVDVIIATPPCQGMSIANHKKGNELSRNSLVIESIKIVKSVNPRFFIFENVRSFLDTSCHDTDGKVKSIREAIFNNLLGNYNIVGKVINFKDVGVPSSRTRTLVIGVRKDLREITPYDLFPNTEEAKTLKDLIGNLPPLKVMGEVYKKDIYHNFRKYDDRMRAWISGLKEGQSAFNNKEPKNRPHRLVNGKIVFNANKNGDKYTRCRWNNIGPCIHTRNDILASQATIHPRDDRVFSIRELMMMMSIPNTFNWSDKTLIELNQMSEFQKRNFLKSNEMNIRQSLGEAVPTLVFEKIAKNVKRLMNFHNFTDSQTSSIILRNKLNDPKSLKEFIDNNKETYSFVQLSKIAEYANSKRTHNAAYYTGQEVCFSIINDLPDFSNVETLRVLEPSVGSGNFLPMIIQKYKTHPNVVIDLVDIDKNSLEILKELVKIMNVPKNIKLNFINADFLLFNFGNINTKQPYQLVIGNPPFMKIKDKQLLQKYRMNKFNKETNNIFSFFIEKSLMLGEYVALITPKSLISTPEYDKTRKVLTQSNILKICDYGESAFDVKIETISIIVSNNKKQNDLIKIESFITNTIEIKEKNYVLSDEFPYWVLYRNQFFDKVKNKLKLGVFTSYRDREITKKHTISKGKIRVLKSRNLSNEGRIVSVLNYDSYVDDPSKFVVSKFLNCDNVVIVPNLSYYPRAAFLPKRSITDGSLALLFPKNGTRVTQDHLDYFKTKEFEEFYSIARNFGTRSLNIDRNSVFFWGVENGL